MRQEKKKLKKRNRQTIDIMAKEGDRVRFLNAIGGGIIRRIDGKTVYVEDDDGFESPFLLKDVVVVMPAGHEAAVKGAKILFDQKAFDDGKKEISENKVEKSVSELKEEKPMPVEETSHGDVPSVILAFEPHDIKKLGTTKFTGVIVNDSNYYLDFILLRRADDERGWQMVFQGTVNPNELMDVAVLTSDELPDYERIVLQGFAYKKDKTFSVLPPLNVKRKLDMTKFHKLHCFRQSRYFDGEVLEYPLITGGLQVNQPVFDADEIKESILKKTPDKELSKELSKKYRVDNGKKNEKKDESAANPFKLLPLIEVDLHIGELTDTTAGMEPKDMLELQLDVVRKTMSAHSRRKGQKIVFIHGKGEGVLRKAVLELLKKEYPKADLQDASFREYGFGATLVTV